MAIRLHNSLTRRKDDFEPQEPGRVTMYVCGPTVYDVPHIGNARSAVVFDTLYRLLRQHFADVRYVRNITDVDDKINAASAERGIPIRELTETTFAAYRADMAALGVLDPVLQPRVTDTIPEIIGMIETLVAAGHAYAAEGHVLFSVGSFAEYGRLSGRSVEEMIAGARVEIAPYKRDAADFVLWKPSSPELPGWHSPWGFGRPGWHIECSAMIERHLGQTIDIHGGGNDLTFPHHENELAQSSCAHGGAPLARYWIHNGMLTVDGQKMSKSLGNFLTVQDVLSWGIPGEAIRYYMLKTHYRQPMDWTKAGLGQAWKELDRFYGALRQAGPLPGGVAPDSFVEALDDDLNTPLAVSLLHDLAGKVNTADAAARQEAAASLKAAGSLLGLLAAPPEAWFTGDVEDGAAVEERIAARNAARAARNFAEADRIRAELLADGIVLEDGPQGTTWRRAG